jgi:tungstate transport system ATP-binding protein
MTPSAEPLYRLRTVRHAYGARVVLDIDALEIARNETLAVLGPSGSGKTTLLRLLQGLEAPREGGIEFEGRPLGRQCPPEVRRRITTVFQRPLMLDASVRENIGYGLRLRRDPERQRKVDALLEEVGLQKLAGHPARRLSGGELQRVAVARALAIETSVLLLDEPTANLDPFHVVLIERMVRRARERGTTIVLVTHHAFQARRLADRVGVMLSGRFVEIGSTAELLDSPRDWRTRAFLKGEMVY